MAMACTGLIVSAADGDGKTNAMAATAAAARRMAWISLSVCRLSVRWRTPGIVAGQPVAIKARGNGARSRARAKQSASGGVKR
jgi:hypothetical protein